MKTRVYKIILLLVTSLVLVACNQDRKLSSQDSDKVFKESYQNHLAQWEKASSGRSYTYSYSRLCFCFEEYTETRVTVNESGEITKVYKVKASGELEAMSASEFKDVMTIEELFVIVQKKIDESAAYVNVEYDVEYGYPKELYVDFDLRMADDEITYLVKELKF